MSESNIGLNADGSGKKVRTLKRTVGVDEVHEEVHNVTDGAGTVVDPRKNVEITGIVVVGASALPTGAATQVTLAEVKAKTDNLDTSLSGIKSKTDNIDVALSTRALESGGNLATLAGKDFATQTTLALVKAKTDNVDVALSTRALESGGNLATIAGKDFATQTTLALIKAKTDNLDVALSTLAAEATLGTVHGHVDSIDGKVPAKGQATMAGSTPVTLASDQSTTTTGTDADSSKKALDVAIVKKHVVKTKSVSCNTSDHNEIVAAVAGKKIKVVGAFITFDGTVSAFWEDATTAMSGAQMFQTREGYVLSMTAPELAWLETTAGQALQLNLSATVYAHGWIRYTDDDAS